mmetsp:Transcript_9302/g.17141  ORF Transcript_9302/g.17141 Transcript_9302/m.17141 type:complete len:188 (+) Transcript_9302:32-595(+)
MGPAEWTVLISLGSASAVVLSAWFGAAGEPCPPPTFPPRRQRVGTLVHSMAVCMFAGGIALSTVYEQLVAATGPDPALLWWVQTVPSIDGFFVVPSLALAMISGVQKTKEKYGSLRRAPKHVLLTLRLLAGFGLWWGAFDRASQAKAAACEDADCMRAVMRSRLATNVVSCLLVIAIFATMVLKPGS